MLFNEPCKTGQLQVDESTVQVMAPLQKLLWSTPRADVTYIGLKTGPIMADLTIYTAQHTFPASFIAKQKAEQFLTFFPGVPMGLPVQQPVLANVSSPPSWQPPSQNAHASPRTVPLPEAHPEPAPQGPSPSQPSEQETQHAYYPYGMPEQPAPPAYQPPFKPRKKGPNKLKSGLVSYFTWASKYPIWAICIILILFFASYLGGIGVGRASTTNSTTQATPASQPTQAAVTQPTPTTQPTVAPSPTKPPTPTPTPKWTTTHTFQGNGTKKTDIFTVSNQWKLFWSCNPSSSFGGSYNVIVAVVGSDGTPIDPGAVNTICSSSNTHDSTDEYQGGDIYLDVTSEAAWTIQVQELK